VFLPAGREPVPPPRRASARKRAAAQPAAGAFLLDAPVQPAPATTRGGAAGGSAGGVAASPSAQARAHSGTRKTPRPSVTGADGTPPAAKRQARRNSKPAAVAAADVGAASSPPRRASAVRVRQRPPPPSSPPLSNAFAPLAPPDEEASPGAGGARRGGARRRGASSADAASLWRTPPSRRGKDDKPQNRTACMGLHKALIDKSHVPKLEAIALELTNIAFHAQGVLYHVSQLLAAATTPVARLGLLRRLHTNADGDVDEAAVAQGQVVTLTLAQRALSLSRYGQAHWDGERLRVREKAEHTAAESAAARAAADAAPGDAELDTAAGKAEAAAAKAAKAEAAQPRLIDEAAAAYFSGKLAGVREARAVSELLVASVLESAATELKTAATNMLQLACNTAQRLVMKVTYGLSGEDAKEVAKRMGTSTEVRERLGMEEALTRGRQQQYNARRAADAALKKAKKCRAAADEAPSDRNLRTAAATAEAAAAAAADAFEAAKKAAARKAASLTGNTPAARTARAAALNALDDKAFKQRKRRRRAASEEEEPAAAALTPLADIFRAELARLPDSQTQLAQLVYRQELLDRAAAVAPKRVTKLLPLGGHTRRFAHLQQPVLLKLLGLEGKKARTGDNTLAALLSRVFTKRALDSARGGWHSFGATFSTDGVSVHFSVVNKAAEAARLRASEAKARGRAESRAAKAAGQTYERRHVEKVAGAKKPLRAGAATELKERPQQRPEVELPEGAVCTALDTGVKNLFGAAREGYDESARHVPGQPRGAKGRAEGSVWQYTTKQYRDDTGSARCARDAARRLQRLQRREPAFASAMAPDAPAAAAPGAALPAAAGRLAALQERGAKAALLIAHFASRALARHKLHTRMGTQRTLERLRRLLLPTPLHYVVVGDANISSNMRGCPPGAAGVLVAFLRHEAPGRVFTACEFRSSMLDSQTHTCAPVLPLLLHAAPPWLRCFLSLLLFAEALSACTVRSFLPSPQRDVQPGGRAGGGPRGHLARALRVGPLPVLQVGLLAPLEPRRERCHQHPVELAGAAGDGRDARALPPRHAARRAGHAGLRALRVPLARGLLPGLAALPFRACRGASRFALPCFALLCFLSSPFRRSLWLTLCSSHVAQD
jgi:hypothetical protein